MAHRGGIRPADARRLMSWFEPRRMLYPWRRDPDPYRVLVSEVMLQQTQASRVEPAFERFVEAFPTVTALAAAPRCEACPLQAGCRYRRTPYRAARLPRPSGEPFEGSSRQLRGLIVRGLV